MNAPDIRQCDIANIVLKLVELKEVVILRRFLGQTSKIGICLRKCYFQLELAHVRTALCSVL